MKHRFFPSYLPALVLLLLPLALCLLAGDASAAQSAGIKLPENPVPAYITLGILACSAVLFFTEVIPMPITALLVPVALVLTKVLSSKVAFSFFGDPTVVLFMAMFIVGEGTFVTGFADKIGNLAMRVSHGSQRLLLLSTMIAVGGLSIVLSNTGTAVTHAVATGNFSFYGPGLKLYLCALMITGRLELFTVIILFTRNFWGRNR